MKHLLKAAILMAAGHCYANSPALYECIYNYNVDIKSEKPINEQTNCILQIGDDKSLFYNYAAFQLDSVSFIGVSEEIKEKYATIYQKEKDYFEQIVITDLPTENITVYCDIAPDHYRYTQKLPLIDWKISEETDTVCGYLCHKARGEYGGREWTVWYADEISVPFGPWKLSGLPGLVLKGIDSEKTHDFEAISFRNATSEISAPKIPNVNSINADKFIERKNVFDLNPMGAIDKESITTVEANQSGLLIINGARIRNYPQGYKPLEYSESQIRNGKTIDSKKQKKNPGKSEDIQIIGVGTGISAGSIKK